MAQNLDLRCVLISDPSTLGAGAKTRLESRIKEIMPHCVCRPTLATMKARPVNPKFLNRAPFFQNGLQAKSGFEMCFDIGSRHLGCWGQNTSRIQNKEVYATLCVQASAKYLSLNSKMSSLNSKMSTAKYLSLNSKVSSLHYKNSSMRSGTGNAISEVDYLQVGEHASFKSGHAKSSPALFRDFLPGVDMGPSVLAAYREDNRSPSTSPLSRQRSQSSLSPLQFQPTLTAHYQVTPSMIPVAKATKVSQVDACTWNHMGNTSLFTPARHGTSSSMVTKGPGTANCSPSSPGFKPPSSALSASVASLDLLEQEALVAAEIEGLKKQLAEQAAIFNDARGAPIVNDATADASFTSSMYSPSATPLLPNTPSIHTPSPGDPSMFNTHNNDVYGPSAGDVTAPIGVGEPYCVFTSGDGITGGARCASVINGALRRSPNEHFYPTHDGRTEISVAQSYAAGANMSVPANCKGAASISLNGRAVTKGVAMNSNGRDGELSTPPLVAPDSQDKQTPNTLPLDGLLGRGNNGVWPLDDLLGRPGDHTDWDEHGRSTTPTDDIFAEGFADGVYHHGGDANAPAFDELMLASISPVGGLLHAVAGHERDANTKNNNTTDGVGDLLNFYNTVADQEHDATAHGARAIGTSAFEVRDGKSTSPFEDLLATMWGGGGGTAVATGAGGTTVATGAGGTAVATGTSGTTVATGAGGTAVATGGGGTAPLGQAGNAAPATGALLTTALSPLKAELARRREALGMCGPHTADGGSAHLDVVSPIKQRLLERQAQQQALAANGAGGHGADHDAAHMRPIQFSDVEEELVGIAAKAGADEHMAVSELEQLLYNNADFKAFTLRYGFDLKADGTPPISPIIIGNVGAAPFCYLPLSATFPIIMR